MMRVAEATEKLRRVVGSPKAWVRRELKEGRRFYDAGIGERILATYCFSPEQAYMQASLNFDIEERIK